MTLIRDRINENISEEIPGQARPAVLRQHPLRARAGRAAGRQKAIDQAQSGLAEVSRMQVRVAQAKADADANRDRQRGYDSCPGCQRIDAIKALPPGLTALGGEFAMGVR